MPAGAAAAGGAARGVGAGGVNRPLGVMPGGADGGAAGAGAGAEAPKPEPTWWQKNWLFVAGEHSFGVRACV